MVPRDCVSCSGAVFCVQGLYLHEQGPDLDCTGLPFTVHWGCVYCSGAVFRVHMGYLLEYAWSLLKMHRDRVSCSGAVFCVQGLYLHQQGPDLDCTGLAFTVHCSCV
jgi:hypothetical protein